MKILLVFLGSLLLLSSAQNYSQCSGVPNPSPVLDLQPTLLNSTTNGKKFILQDPNSTAYYSYLAILEGSSYEMGYAMGSLFYEEINTFVTVSTDFIYNLGSYWISVLPNWMQEWELSSDAVIQMGLHFEEIATAHYTPQRFFDELRGIADAADVSYTQLLQCNLFPELTRAICTILGAWGPATPDGNLIHLRALDYLATAPMNSVQTITIYRSTEEGSQHFANFGWAGMIGALAGYSGLVGIGERVSDNDDDAISTILGEPWMFVLRDVLQFGTDLQSAYKILNDAHRTYNILLGVGSQAENSFRGFQYNYVSLEMFTDQNWTQPWNSWHSQMDGVVFWDKGFGNDCINSILLENYGNITPELLYRDVVGLRETGDTIVAVYLYQTNEVYLSFATNFQPAYGNPIFYLNMTDLFNTPVPPAEGNIKN